MKLVTIKKQIFLIPTDVYWYIRELEIKVEETEKKLKEAKSIPTNLSVEMYKNITESYIFRDLVHILEEVAEFRTTNKIDDKDKVIVLLPEKYELSTILCKRGGSSE